MDEQWFDQWLKKLKEEEKRLKEEEKRKEDQWLKPLKEEEERIKALRLKERKKKNGAR